MSTVEEDAELRDLVAQTLEKNGCLAKLRAELRASIFLALEEDIKLSKQQPLQNLRIQSYLETPEGRAMFCLVREFLEFFNLQFTISVYEPESYLDSIYHYEGRQKTARDLGLENIDESTVPLLQHLLKIAQGRNKVLDINLNLDNNINSSFKDESLNIDSSYKKTESECVSSKETLDDILPEKNQEYLNTTFDVNTPIDLNNGNKTSQQHEVNTETHKNTKENIMLIEKSATLTDFNNDANTIKNNDLNITGKEPVNKPIQLNETFDVNSPTLNHTDFRKLYIDNEQNQINLKIINEDDTYEDTSSIAEDIEFPTISSLKLNEINSVPQIDVSLNDSQSLTLTKSKTESEKMRTSTQWPKTTLGCLSDLPTLPMTNKTILSNQILPSLYSKEFKDKGNLKELDTMFDMEAEYEEDFMCSSNDLSLTNSTLHSLQQKNSSNSINKSEVSSAVSSNPHSSSNLSSKIRSYKKTSHTENGSSIKEHSLSD